jgi:predicted DsbA family dithiol-disulfide isomerase
MASIARHVLSVVRIEIWSDVVCPWCYLGKWRFERALDSFDHRDEVEVTYRSFELDPDAQRGVTTSTVERLAAKYGMSAQQASDAQRQMEERATADGLEFHLDDLRSGNTRDAHRLLHLAKGRQRQGELTERLHRAYFTEQRSIFDSDSLLEVAVEAGLDTDDVVRVLNSDTYDDDVAADEATGHALGVTGVPFFVIDRRFGISGAQPAEVITEALNNAWAADQAS